MCNLAEFCETVGDVEQNYKNTQDGNFKNIFKKCLWQNRQMLVSVLNSQNLMQSMHLGRQQQWHCCVFPYPTSICPCFLMIKKKQTQKGK